MCKQKKVQYDLYKDGFCFLPSLFSKEEIVSAYNGLKDVINGKYNTGREPERRFWEVGDDPNSIIKIDKPHICNESVWALITKPKFGRALSKATNSNKIQVWHSQVVWKPKSKGLSGNAGWHRDAQYWPFWSEKGLYTAWIALSKVSKYSGPVRFIPRSNKWENIEELDFFNKNIKTQDKILDKFFEHRTVVNSTLNIGEVSIHTSQTYHSSIQNKEDSPRVGMVVHFCTEEAQRLSIIGRQKNYLDQLKDPKTTPVIYDYKNEKNNKKTF